MTSVNPSVVFFFEIIAKQKLGKRRTSSSSGALLHEFGKMMLV